MVERGGYPTTKEKFGEGRTYQHNRPLEETPLSPESIPIN